jgi:hypothetical protein
VQVRPSLFKKEGRAFDLIVRDMDGTPAAIAVIEAYTAFVLEAQALREMPELGLTKIQGMPR